MLKRLTLIVFVVLNALSCAARKCTYHVPGETIKVIKRYIGNHDYHKFGPVVMEQNEGRYYITFPFLLYTDDDIYTPEDKMMPSGTIIRILLNDSEIITAKTNQNTKVLWYYSYDSYILNPGKTYDVELPGPYRVYPGENFTHDNYGLCWLLKFEFTAADMLLMSKRRILEVYTVKNRTKIYLPIKRRQSLRIQDAAASLLN